MGKKTKCLMACTLTAVFVLSFYAFAARCSCEPPCTGTCDCRGFTCRDNDDCGCTCYNINGWEGCNCNDTCQSGSGGGDPDPTHPPWLN